MKPFNFAENELRLVYKCYLEIIDVIYMYIKDLALNNPQCLIWYKTEPKLFKLNSFFFCSLARSKYLSSF